MAILEGKETGEGCMGFVSGTCFIYTFFFSPFFSQLASQEELETTTERSKVQDPDATGCKGGKSQEGT